MARFSRNKSRPAARTVSPWMTAFYICAILFAPMLFMGMIPSASAQEQEPMKADDVSGPGAYTYPPHHQLGPQPSAVCEKPVDGATCPRDEWIICGNAVDSEDVEGPGGFPGSQQSTRRIGE